MQRVFVNLGGEWKELSKSDWINDLHPNDFDITNVSEYVLVMREGIERLVHKSHIQLML